MKIDAALRKFGFTDTNTHTIKGRESIADLYSSGQRCGVYILHFSNGDYYVGQTKDIMHRYAAHKRTYNDIERISFRQTKQTDLSSEEFMTIHLMEQAGLRLRNIVGVDITYAKTDFDLLMTPADQMRWREDVTFQDHSGTRPEDEALRYRYNNNFQMLQNKMYFNNALKITRRYIQSCIPAYRRSEMSFWNVSCLPTTGDGSAYLRVNVGRQMVFDVLRYHSHLKYRWILPRHAVSKYLQTDLQKLDNNTDLVRYLADRKPEKYLYKVRTSNLVSASSDQVILDVRYVLEAKKLLTDQVFLRACRDVTLELMRKSPCLWQQNHCLDLADRLVEI